MKSKIIIIKGGELKTRVVSRAFSQLLPNNNYEYLSFEVSASEQHIISKDECLKLMQQKIAEAKLEYPDALYFIFMRGRFDDFGLRMEEAALVLIQDSAGNEGVSQAASFEVPSKVADLVRQGVSFSKAVEAVYAVENVKEGSGFVGILTNSIVTKEEQYFHPTAIALATCISKS